jgi:hypothetical protein
VLPPITSKIKIAIAIIIALVGLWLFGLFDAYLPSSTLIFAPLIAKKPEGWRNKRPSDSWAHAEAARGRSTKGRTPSGSSSKPLYPATKPKATWFDVTPNELRYRLREPDSFSDFRRKKISRGVSLLFGKLRNRDDWEIQSLRFSRKDFTLADAQKWIKNHPDLININKQ